MKVINVSSNSLNSLIVPVSHFLFCALAVLFVLLHPSALYAPFLPLIMLAFFFQPGPDSRYYSIISKIFISITSFFLAALFAYQLYSLISEDSLLAKWRMTKIDQTQAKVIKMFGLHKNSLSMRQFFPTSCEFLLYLLLIAFATLSRPPKSDSIDGTMDNFAARESYIPRDSEMTEFDTAKAMAPHD
jgi:hypothetical protein